MATNKGCEKRLWKEREETYGRRSSLVYPVIKIHGPETQKESVPAHLTLQINREKRTKHKIYTERKGGLRLTQVAKADKSHGE